MPADPIAGTARFMQKGDVVPDFELPDETGQMRKLSDLLAGARSFSTSILRR